MSDETIAILPDDLDADCGCYICGDDNVALVVRGPRCHVILCSKHASQMFYEAKEILRGLVQ